MQQCPNIRIGSIAKYSLLPQVLPRIRDLVGSGFGHLTFFMAHAYRAVNLLPAHHPYLQIDNLGRYSIWELVGAARANLVMSREHLDQVIVFFSLFVGIVLLLMQCLLLVISLLTNQAWAGDVGAYWAQFFVTPNPEDDIAFVTLDRVFGVPNIYNSRVAGGSDGTFPSPFHQGLHAMLEFYSIGVFAVAIIIIIYYVITLVGETAKTGTPFGRRFNGVWAPIRLILAIALLAPIHMGLNISQLATLRVAKWGSSMATNGWIEFNETIVNAGSTQLGDRETLIAMPNEPQLNSFLELMLVARTCVHMHKFLYDRDVDAYVIPAPRFIGTGTSGNGETFTGTDFNGALGLSNNGTINVVIGEQHEDFDTYPGQVNPTCGKFTIPVVDLETAGAMILQQRYYEEAQFWWTHGRTDNYAKAIAQRFVPTEDRDLFSSLPTLNYIDGVKTTYGENVAGYITEAREAQIADSDWADFASEYGWAGAGIWYNKIAQYNGTLFAAVHNLPTPVAYPEIMEYVRSQRMAEEGDLNPETRYSPYRTDSDQDGGGAIDYRDPNDFYIAQALYYAEQRWADEGIASTQNPITDVIHLIFGTTGLFDMRENIDEGVHPMAALIGIGSSLIESTVVNLGAGVFGGILSIAPNSVLGTIGSTISGVAFKIAIVGLMLGFILYYVVPFMPFIYFFFAFGGWVKAIFEAMVGLPLWALAHIKIDGEGIAGPLALDGYLLVFEIFVRPIVIIFATISSMAVFSALVLTLNSVWELVVTNLTGVHTADAPTAPSEMTATGMLDYARGLIDYLFYTVVYAIFVYLIATSSFKLIDLVPNYMLRWLGKMLKTIGEGDLSEDPGRDLVMQTYVGGNMMIGQLQSSTGGALNAIAMRMGR